MASPESGEEPFGDEWQLRVDVHTAVERAFDRAPDGVDREPTALELEKAALFVVWEFDLDLTRSDSFAHQKSPISDDPGAVSLTACTRLSCAGEPGDRHFRHRDLIFSVSIE